MKIGETLGVPRARRVIMKERKRIFTLREAQKALPKIRELTASAVVRAEALSARIDSSPAGEERMHLETQYNALIRAWAEQVMDSGCEVKGLWLVDFDSGDGIYYCWRHPEHALQFFHDYDAGLAGRRPLGPLAVG
jgi:hypothetical protein